MTRLAWAFIAGALALAAVYGAGVFHGRTVVTQEWNISKLQDKNAADAFTGKLSLLGLHLTDELLASRADNATLSDKLKKAVPRVATVYVPSPGAAAVALPDYRFTRGALCLYGAFGVSADQGGATARADAEARCLAATDSLYLSDVTPGDLLDADIGNAQSCRDDRDTLDRAQAFLAALAAGQ